MRMCGKVLTLGKVYKGAGKCVWGYVKVCGVMWRGVRFEGM